MLQFNFDGLTLWRYVKKVKVSTFKLPRINPQFCYIVDPNNFPNVVTETCPSKSAHHRRKTPLLRCIDSAAARPFYFTLERDSASRDSRKCFLVPTTTKTVTRSAASAAAHRIDKSLTLATLTQFWSSFSFYVHSPSLSLSYSHSLFFFTEVVVVDAGAYLDPSNDRWSTVGRITLLEVYIFEGVQSLSPFHSWAEYNPLRGPCCTLVWPGGRKQTFRCIFYGICIAEKLKTLD